jgi:hypothetical protein
MPTNPARSAPKNELNSITLTDPKAIKAYEAFRAFLVKKGLTYTGGCTTFYTPEEWKARGEKYGTEALFVVVHDGGDVAGVCSYDHGNYALIEEGTKAMAKVGAYIQQCTGWYSACYDA